MGIRQIENAPGVPKKCYSTGHTQFCFKCRLWVRWIGDNELCKHCQLSTGNKDKISMFNTNQMLQAGQGE